MRRPGWIDLARVCARSLLAAPLLASTAVSAQTYEPLLDTDIPVAVPSLRNKTVLERPHPELAPQGIGAGGFRIYPELGVEPGYTTNALGSTAGPSEDGFVTLQPRVRAESQWSRHALSLSLGYDARRYARVSAKDENGFRARADGRLDIHGESSLVAALAYERSYEGQYTGSFPANGGASIAVRHPSALLRGTFVANRVRLVASSDYNRFNYSDTMTLSGTPLDQDYRDRRVFRASGRAEYLFAADSAAFAQVTYRRTRYDSRTNPLTDRTSKEMRLVAGFVADVTPIVRVAIGIGYADRRYDQPGIRPVRDVVADLRVDYNVTPLTTFSLAGRRGIEEAIVPNAAGYVASKVGIRADHELLRNLLLNLAVDHERDDFKGIARQDRLTRVSAGGTYTMSRNVMLTPQLDYVRRKSEGVSAGPSFKEVRFVLRASLRI